MKNFFSLIVVSIIFTGCGKPELPPSTSTSNFDSSDSGNSGNPLPLQHVSPNNPVGKWVTCIGSSTNGASRLQQLLDIQSSRAISITYSYVQGDCMAPSKTDFLNTITGNYNVSGKVLHQFGNTEYFEMIISIDGKAVYAAFRAMGNIMNASTFTNSSVSLESLGESSLMLFNQIQ